MNASRHRRHSADAGHDGAVGDAQVAHTTYIQLGINHGLVVLAHAARASRMEIGRGTIEDEFFHVGALEFLAGGHFADHKFLHGRRVCI